MDKLLAMISELETKVPFCDTTKTEISEASVGWHIEHTLLATNRIILSMMRSDPAAYQWKFNKIRAMVFMMNKIPRGKGKAPQAAQPAGDITIEGLKAKFTSTLKNIAMLQNMEARKFFDHPLFGHLNLKSTKKFLKIHTKHHLKIIEDILQAAGKI